MLRVTARADKIPHLKRDSLSANIRLADGSHCKSYYREHFKTSPSGKTVQTNRFLQIIFQLIATTMPHTNT